MNNTEKSKVCIISGGSSGIGEACVTVFNELGYHVYNVDTAAPSGSSPSTWIPCDVTDWVRLHDKVDAIGQQHGRIHVVVANAGISQRRRFEDSTSELLAQVISVNLLGVMGLWHACLPYLLSKSVPGVALATASTNGVCGYPFYADYNASKAGVISIVKTLALEYSGRLRTGCVSPGYVMTEMQRREYSENMLEDLNKKIPAGRHADPLEIAKAFAFLASDDARFFNGQQLILDGGELAGGVACSLPHTTDDRGRQFDNAATAAF